jgi:hypothetical protein
MLAMHEVRYAARDAAAGSLALLDATDYMRRGAVRAELLELPGVEAVSIALNTAALLSLAERQEVIPPLERWEAAELPGIEFGRALFESGDLQRLAASGTPVNEVVDRLAGGSLVRFGGPLAQ